MSKINDLPLPGINAVLKNDHNTSLVTFFYILVSLFTTFINKYLTTASEYKFNYPYTVVFFQLVISILFIHFWKIWQTRYSPWIRFTKILSINWRVILPSTCIYICMIVMDPIFLTHVPLAYYTSMKAPCIIFMLFYSIVYRQKGISGSNSNNRSDRFVWISCFIQYVGMWLVTSHSILFTYNWITLVYAILATIYPITVQRSLKKIQYDITQFLQWQLILATVLMIPILFISGELKPVFQSVLFLDEFSFWIQMILGALFSISLQFLMISLIKYSSPLSFIVASICKICLQILIAWFCFRNPLSLYNFTCILISLSGAILYFKLTLKTSSLTNVIYPV